MVTLKRIGSLLFAVLLCVTSPAFASPAPECGEIVSLPTLIAKPDAYHGKVLWVVAHVTIDFENMSACPSEDETEMKGCLWLDIDNGPHRTDQDVARYLAKLQIWKRFDRQTVAIRATFDKTLTGHFGMWPGGLNTVTEVSGNADGWSFASNAALPRTACVGQLPAQ